MIHFVWFLRVLVKYMHPGSITPFETEQRVTVVPQNNDTTIIFPPTSSQNKHILNFIAFCLISSLLHKIQAEICPLCTDGWFCEQLQSQTLEFYVFWGANHGC